MDIQSAVASYAPRGADPVGSIVPTVPIPASPTTTSEPLGPAATVDLSKEARSAADRPAPEAKSADQSQRRFSVDADSRQIVFQVYDPTSNTVLDQLPDVPTLRARIYAREHAAQPTPAQPPPTQTVDRTA